MKIAHIFNEIKEGRQEFITPQEFDINYIDNYNRVGKNKVDNLQDDFEKKYYHALFPVEDRSIISKYDEEKLNSILENFDNQLLLISGDFWGIQKFIFNDLTSKKASKILRSRSAILQLITYAVTKIIKDEFKNSDTLLFGAGKFLIIAGYEENYKEKINSTQKELDKFFIQNYFGENGIILSSVETTKNNIENQDSEEMKEDLLKLGKNNELNKLNKFNFYNLDEVVIDIFEDAKNDSEICHFCKKRIATEKIDGEECCEICANQIALGEYLTKKEYVKIYETDKKSNDIFLLEYDNRFFYAKFSNEMELDIDVFDISNKRYRGIPKWSLNSYVAKKDDYSIKSFEEIQGNSQGLMALKADVDKLGDTFRNYYMTSFKKFNRLSRELDFFFSDYVTYYISQNYNNIYIVFAGGDDLFLIGEYKEVIKLVKDIRNKFYQFSVNKSTLSMGFVMFKHSTPINYISDLADEAEKRAKEVKDENGNTRNGIDIFGIPMKFDEFTEISDLVEKLTKKLEEQNKDTTTFYYRVLDLCDMRESLNEDNFKIENAQWKSKLSYIFKRNINNDIELLKEFNSAIEKYGKKLKPSLFLKIYQNRENLNKENK